jgi:hypothetical protein
MKRAEGIFKLYHPSRVCPDWSTIFSIILSARRACGIYMAITDYKEKGWTKPRTDGTINTNPREMTGL